MGAWKGFASLALAGWLCACATTPMRGPVPIPGPSAVATPPPSAAARLSFSDLPGWDQEDHVAALLAFEAGCGVSRDPALLTLCGRARALGLADEADSRSFLEVNFQVARIGDQGLLTAYFAPEYEARLHRQDEFTAPVLSRPPDLVMLDLGPFDASLAGRKISGRVLDGKFVPYDDRATIESQPPAEAEAWMRPEDLFFMQIQGGGVLDLPDGRRLKAAFSASNGKPFVGIAGVMRDRGLLPDNGTSGEAIRGWLAAHRGPDADMIMRMNPRYVFFSLAPDDGREPAGAAGAALIPGRALAVDPSRHALGGVYWIDAAAPALSGAFPVYRRLALALDTGGAIKGDVRADLYIGRGAAAGVEAGRVRHVLRLYALEPASPEPAHSP
jgi:membrane-bound lytic murein transglycosylase A